MKITFLGTGTSQGVPLIACKCEVCVSANEKDKRLRSSILVETETTTIVIDTGPDFRQQMLREQVQKLDAVVFTHEHKDHIAGLDDVRAFNFIQQKHMDVYATSRVQAAIKREFAYIFAEEKYPGIPLVNLHQIDLKPFKINDVELVPIEVLHYKMPVLGFRLADFTYITDAKSISNIEKEKIRGSKVLVLNALRREEHISHFTFEEAIALAQELKVERAYFTHISHQLGLHDEVSAELPSNIFLAYDGYKIEI
ncbi:MAG TPA: MBL fold metallo-hydrolase [Bacteroidia bacterium]|nr:MBL fold metallo-hydrolase [Bacteroidia bacterium]